MGLADSGADEIAKCASCDCAGEEDDSHYLLNPAHAAGGSKAVFFLRFGFTLADWQHLAEALLRHAHENEVIASERTRHGMRYVIDGVLRTPDGSALNVRSAWYIHFNSDRPRL